MGLLGVPSAFNVWVVNARWGSSEHANVNMARVKIKISTWEIHIVPRILQIVAIRGDV